MNSLFATLGDELFVTLDQTSQSPAETKPPGEFKNNLSVDPD